MSLLTDLADDLTDLSLSEGVSLNNNAAVPVCVCPISTSIATTDSGNLSSVESRLQSLKTEDQEDLSTLLKGASHGGLWLIGWFPPGK